MFSHIPGRGVTSVDTNHMPDKVAKRTHKMEVQP